jgi:uncharacterized damage-inducible protein DinB
MTITAEKWLSHWQGNRSLTRRAIERFPEDQLFTFSIGGMRTFGDIVKELLALAGPGLEEIVTGVQQKFSEESPYSTKEELLAQWDKGTEKINQLWAQLPEERYKDTIKLFGAYEDSVQNTLFYFVENEIHHRGQGFVYLRALGIEPPFFWER